MAETKKSCFVISPIGDEGSETRKRADQVLKHIIGPAAEACGYEPIRADEIDKPGLITSQVIQRIVSDKLVIADLTEKNPNVFYELAVRHAIRKPLVQIMQKGEKIPFDVAGLRTIPIDHTDLDQAAAAKDAIIRQIQEVESDPDDLETPISVSLDLQALRASENPQDRSLADVLSEISDIKVAVSKQGSETTTSFSDLTDRIQFMMHRLERDQVNTHPSLRHNKSVMRALEHFDLSGSESTYVTIIFFGSLFSKSHPWLYALSAEAYRQVSFGTQKNSQRALGDLVEGIRMLLSGQFGNPREGSPMYEIAERFYSFVMNLERRSV